MKKIIPFLFLCYLQIKAQNKEYILNENIKTVLIQKKNSFQFNSNLFILPFEEYEEYILSFDDLSLNNQSYFLKIEHFDSNWEKSPIIEIIYLKGFNNQPIRQYIQSNSTKVPYLHYEAKLPEIKIGGNYLITVSKDRNGRNPIFTKKIQVLDKKIQPFGKVEFSNFPNLRNTHQKLDLGFQYSPNLYFNNKDDFYFKIFQNGILLENKSWPKPLINDYEKKVYFQFFNGENNIEAGNEFRLIDLRSSQQKLINVAKIEQKEGINLIYTHLNNKESDGVFIQKIDHNQEFLINNYEFPNEISMIDYIYCRFQLKSPFKENEDIYLVGGFNDFSKTESNKLIYDEPLGIYYQDILLKQGIYNYQFIGNKTKSIIEGNFSSTQNRYDILIYLKEPGTNYDNLIGYQQINFPN